MCTHPFSSTSFLQGVRKARTQWEYCEQISGSEWPATAAAKMRHKSHPVKTDSDEYICSTEIMYSK